MQRHSKLILGIDFGTSKSGLAIFEGRGKARILARSGGDGTAAAFPDWAFPTEVVLTTGTTNEIVAPIYLSFSSNYKDNYEDVLGCPGLKQKMRSGSLKLRLGETMLLNNTEYKINDLIPEFLQYMWKELLPGTDPQNAYVVLGMPAGCEYAKRKALVNAAHAAGFAQAELLPEPVAGLLALSKSKDLRDKHILVIDYGGGTCNYAIIVVDKAGHFTIQCARSEPQGGENITEALVKDFGPQGVSDEVTKAKVRRFLDAAKINYVPGEKIPNVEPLTTPDNVTLEFDIDKMKDQKNGFEAKIREAVSAVRDELRRRSNGDDLHAIDEVYFLGESRHLFCFSKLFWDGWLRDVTKPESPFGLIKQESQDIETRTPNGDPFAQSRKMVALGCALHAGSLFASQKTYLHSQTSWCIIGELLDMDGNPLKYRPISNMEIRQKTPLPHEVRLNFTLGESVSGFRVKFAHGPQPSDHMETFEFRPNAHSALKTLPKGTEINFKFKIRRDELIEIELCRATHLMGRPYILAQNLEWHSDLESNS